MFPLQDRSCHRFPADCPFPRKDYLLDFFQIVTSS